MLSPEEYNRRDAVGLAALVATGEVTAAEVVEMGMARIEAAERPLNGVVTTCFDDAHRDVGALLPIGPLAGVPYLSRTSTPGFGTCRLRTEVGPLRTSYPTAMPCWSNACGPPA